MLSLHLRLDLTYQNFQLKFCTFFLSISYVLLFPLIFLDLFVCFFLSFFLILTSFYPFIVGLNSFVAHSHI